MARAVDEEIDRVASAVEGQRNHALYTASFALGQLVGAQLVDHHQAEHDLEAAASIHYGHPPSKPFTRNEARRTIASGLHRGTRHPRHLPADLTLERSTR